LLHTDSRVGLKLDHEGKKAPVVGLATRNGSFPVGITTVGLVVMSKTAAIAIMRRSGMEKWQCPEGIRIEIIG
jgi:hypothetical protein